MLLIGLLAAVAVGLLIGGRFGPLFNVRLRFGALIGVASGALLEWYTVGILLPDESGFVFPLRFPWATGRCCWSNTPWPRSRTAPGFWTN